MTTATRTPEQDVRLNILNTLLTCPHRQLNELYPVHAEMARQDPLFYVHLAAWYNDTGDVRDHKEMFITNLCLSDFEGHRDVGLAMLRELPPYQLQRVVDFVHGTKKTVRATPTRNRRAAATATPAPAAVSVVNQGLERNIPRSMVTEVERYLREREADPDWFDSVAMIARKSLRRLYGVLHIKPSDRADKIVFKGEPPEDSKIFAVKQLVKASTPAEQAKAIIEYKIPYRIASTIVNAMTPTVMLALIEVMSDQELINNLGSLRKRGVLDNPEMKKVVEQRLEKAKTGKRVAALKGMEAVKAAGVSEDLQEKLKEVADTQVKARGVIKRSTALLIDKSGSMSQAIEIGKQIANMISAITEAQLFVYAFDTMAYPIQCNGKTLADWERALRGINAGGGTSCGVSLEYMIRAKQVAETIILVTDEGENQTPSFIPTLKKYKETFKVEPGVIIVKVQGATNQLELEAQRNGVALDAYQFTGDYYALPNLIPFLTRPGRLDLLMDIMQYELPKRKAA